MRCNHCNKKLNDNNCTMIQETCDNCLTDKAVDTRNDEMACEDGILFELNLSI